MYASVLPRVLPLLLGVPVLAVRLRRDHRDVLGLWLLAVGALYVLGALTGNSSLGRTLAFLVVVLAIALGDWVGRFEVDSTPRQRALVAIAAGALAVAGVLFALGGVVRMVPSPLLPTTVRDAEELDRPDEEYAFLEDVVGSDEVVVGSRRADDRTIPALAGRVLTLAAPRPFVADEEERLEQEKRVLGNLARVQAAANRAYDALYDSAVSATVKPSTETSRNAWRAAVGTALKFAMAFFSHA